jgi:hypothetical protein
MNSIAPKGTSLNDILLLDIARKIQLSQTQYGEAVSRYQTINEWLERDGSPLKGLVKVMYPQGSMAVGTTISSNLDDEEFDIDIIAELADSLRNQGPRRTLDQLFDAINGERGSRYFGMVTRNSRCVTVQYANMHLDVTPAILLPNSVARTSTIFHSKRESPPSTDKTLIANPWGFAQWFLEQLPDVSGNLPTLAKRAEAVPVIEQPKLFERSLPMLALQLIKRWKNKQYAKRECRWPPSVLLTCLVGERSGALLAMRQQHSTLFAALLDLVSYIQTQIEVAHRAGLKIYRANPRCASDILTDRWPETVENQRQFLDDLRKFLTNLTTLDDPNQALPRKAELLEAMFGERVTRLVVDDLQKRLADEVERGVLPQQIGTGRLLVAPALLTPRPAEPRVQQAPRHTFFGGTASWPRKK